MTDIFYNKRDLAADNTLMGLDRRYLLDVKSAFVTFAEGLADARNSLRLYNDLSRLDRHQLRDIGLDRGAC